MRHSIIRHSCFPYDSMHEIIFAWQSNGNEKQKIEKVEISTMFFPDQFRVGSTSSEFDRVFFSRVQVSLLTWNSIKENNVEE